MEILRYGHDSNGAQVLNGVSWDILPLAFWAGVAVIVVHLLMRALRKGPDRRGEG
jgi:hypothetical protein